MFLLSVYRNRLESNTEHWNALLLSLRELIEWVIRKDTELTGLGPVCGDVAALQKQEASFFDLATSIVCVSTLSLLFRRTKNVLVKDRCFDGKKKDTIRCALVSIVVSSSTRTIRGILCTAIIAKGLKRRAKFLSR